MADSKLSDLTAASSVVGADLVYVVQSGTNDRKATITQLASAINTYQPNCLVFDGNPKSAFHGQFWTAGVPLGQFLWEFVCRFDGNNIGQGYLISEGYGGAHAILFGLTPLPAGNVFDGSGNVTIGPGDYTPQAGEWLYAAVGWDGTYLYTWVNGMPTSLTPWTGPRFCQGGGPFGTLFIGGSDHSNFQGAIAGARGFEFPAGGGSMPIFGIGGTATSSYAPDLSLGPFRPNSTTVGAYAQFCASYQGGMGSIPDLGLGYGGAMHGGLLQGYPNSSPPVYALDSTYPGSTGYPASHATRTPPAPTSAPGGSKIFDSFGRADSIPLFATVSGGDYQVTLGSTESGSLGPLAYTAPFGKWGVFQGCAVYLFNGVSNPGSLTYVSNNSADMDVRVDRHNAAGYAPSASGGYVSSAQNSDIGLAFRVQDASNYFGALAYHDAGGANVVLLYAVIGGSGSFVATWTLPNYTWTTLRITTSGTTITGYVDATSIGTLTSSQFQTATGVGLFTISTTAAIRWRNFTVF